MDKNKKKKVSYQKGNKMVKPITALFKVTKPVPAKVDFALTNADKAGGLKALDAIEKVFGPKGKYWVQGSFHTVEQGFDAFCLAGAAAKANGPYEPVARAAIALAIAKREGSLDFAADEQEVIDQAARETRIVEFNDSEATKWSDVKAILASARKMVKDGFTYIVED